MERKDIQQGVRVAIPTNRAANEAPSFYLQALLKNQRYPLDYLVIGEPWRGDDNVRLYMVPPWPRFCVETFNASDLTIYDPAAASPAIEREPPASS